MLWIGSEAVWRWLERQGGTQKNGSTKEQGAEIHVPAADFLRCLRELEARAGVFNLSADTVHLAYEIAALESDLVTKQRLALIVLCVASLVALSQGSTRLAIAPVQEGQALRRIVAALCGESFRAVGLNDVAGEIETLLESEKNLRVIGRNPLTYAPLLYLRPFIYHQRVYKAEVSLAERLATLLRQEPPAVDLREIKAALEDISQRPPIQQGRALKLSDEQRAAIAAAANFRMTLISGAPGTGKTSIIAAILRLFTRIGLSAGSVALAAPTGKAANRMGEALEEMLGSIREPDEHDLALRSNRPAPQTLHRLLAYSPSRGRFQHHRNNPLPASVVIVDEASMVDLYLMRVLADALSAESRLILLGDHDQLPSVAAGAVFRDLVQVSTLWRGQGRGVGTVGRAGSVCGTSVRLERSYRVTETLDAGKQISAVACAINAGALTSGGASWFDQERPPAKRASPEDLAFQGVELLGSGVSEIGAFLERWYIAQLQGSRRVQKLAQNVYDVGESDALEPAESHRLWPLFNHLQSARILCATRVFATGSERINAVLHARAALQAGEPPDREAFLPGEPVIALSNDYARGLFNGDQGVVLRVRSISSGRSFLAAVFPRRDTFHAFPLETLGGFIELCYAVTVHKAQGSEFDTVALVMPEEDLPLLTRELLYTALTRSRRSFVLIGNEELISTAANRKTERCSGLADHLIAALKTER
jgi:exodeoxyribonuclease V alpha subunit